MPASPIPQTWYAYLITLPHLGITGSRYYTSPGGHDLRVPWGGVGAVDEWPAAVRSRSPSRSDAQIAGGASEEFRTGELALQHEPLGHGERLPRTAEHHLALAVDFQAATIEHQ